MELSNLVGKEVTVKLNTGRWTFAWRNGDGKWAGPWTNSKKRFNDPMSAAHAAGDWMVICMENDFPVNVKLMEVANG